MKKKRKNNCLIVILIILAFVISACKNNKEITTIEINQNTSIIKSDKLKTSLDILKSKEQNIPKDKIVIYSFGDEFSKMMDAYYFSDNPEYKELIEIVNIDTLSDYKEELDNALEEDENAPDMFLLDATMLEEYCSSDITMSIEDVGIYEDEYQYQYPYTIEAGTDARNNKLKALAYKAQPVVLLYNYPAASEALMTADISKVTLKINSIEHINETAAALKESGFCFLSSVEDMKEMYLNTREVPFINENGEIQVDDRLLEYLDQAKVLSENEYTNGTIKWENEWVEDTYNSKIFCWYATNDFINNVMVTMNQDIEGNNEANYGKYYAIRPTWDYYSGGTFLAVSSKCKNNLLAADILRYWTCDFETMYVYGMSSGAFVNNTKVINKMISYNFTNDFINSKDYFSLLNEAALNITYYHMGKDDEKYIEKYNEILLEYCNEKISREEAIEKINNIEIIK